MSAKGKIVLKKLPNYSNIWHPDSTLVFKSAKDRTVIGRYVDSELLELDEECLEICKLWKFKPNQEELNNMTNEIEDEGEDEQENKEESDQESEPENKQEEETDKPEESDQEGTLNQIKEETDTPQKLEDQLNDVLTKFSTDILSIMTDFKQEYEKQKNTLSIKTEDLSKLQKKFDTMKSIFN